MNTRHDWEAQARQWMRERDEALDKLARCRSYAMRKREELASVEMGNGEAHDAAIATVLHTIDHMPGINTVLLMELRRQIEALKVKQ